MTRQGDSGRRRADDATAVATRLGRDPDGAYVVAVRDAGGAPVVIANEPFLRDGTPMPTRYWLVDAELRARVSGLEAEGGVRSAEAEVDTGALTSSHRRYAAERDALIPPGWTGPRPSGGVGGTRQGVKCLHAHLAWWLAGGDDPVGAWVAERLDLDRANFVGEPSEMSEHDGPVAVLDCGTNSTRLLVMDADGTVLAREMRITRLGQGVDASRRLSKDAIDRTLSVLSEYRALMDAHGVIRTRLVATSAARDADNVEEFLAAASHVAGVRAEVLTGEEEGWFSFLGATATLPAPLVGAGPVLVVDIGGGSTELVVGRVPAAESGEAGGAGPVSEVVTRSLDIGCVRITERVLEHDPPLPEEMARARVVVEAEVASARADLPPLAPDSTLIGLAGTVSTLASLEQGLATYDRARVHHAVLERDAVERWLRVLVGEDSRTRLDHPGMVAGREEVIVAGIVILDVVMAQFDCARCLVSEDDILDGLARRLLSSARPVD